MGRGKIFSFAETKYEWNMKEISVSELQDNMFDAIGKEWMLVTAGTQEKFNMMTASWGGTGKTSCFHLYSSGTLYIRVY